MGWQFCRDWVCCCNREDELASFVVFAAAHAGSTYRSLLLVIISVKQRVMECLKAK